MKIKDIIMPGLITISQEATMAEAEKLLSEKRIRHLPVSNGSTIIGIISDKDIHRARTVIKVEDKTETVIQGYKKVSDYMSSPVLKLKLSDSVEHLTREMIRLKISSFIIDDDSGKSVGIITTEDLLFLLLEKVDTATPLSIIKKMIKGFS